MSKVRYGIIGIGRMGGTHAKKLNKGKDPNAELTAVCDTDPERRDWAKKNLKDVAVYEDYKDLIGSDKVDVVVVATPHYDHPVIGMEALKADKHLLIEKPAGVYTEKVRELNELAAQYPGRVFGIMYNQRTNPLYRKAKELIDSGEMGKLKRINWVVTNWYRPQAYYDLGGWRGTWGGEGGGVLMNQAPHQLDLFQWLGGMPNKVRGYCKVGVGRDINVENDVTFYTEYDSGATGVFVTSTHDAPGTNRLEIDGDGGRLVIEQNGLAESFVFNKLSRFESDMNDDVNTSSMPFMRTKKIKARTGALKNIVTLGLVGQHMGIFRNFSRAVLYGEPLIAPGVEGINGLTLANAAYLSAWLDETVALPLDEKLYKKELDKRVAEEEKSGKKRV